MRHSGWSVVFWFLTIESLVVAFMFYILSQLPRHAG